LSIIASVSTAEVTVPCNREDAFVMLISEWIVLKNSVMLYNQTLSVSDRWLWLEQVPKCC
jgi:hypothetical protein